MSGRRLDVSGREHLGTRHRGQSDRELRRQPRRTWRRAGGHEARRHRLRHRVALEPRAHRHRAADRDLCGCRDPALDGALPPAAVVTRPDPLAFLTSELDHLKEQGLYHPLRVLEGEQKAAASFDHHHVVNLSSNNYLGLTTHPLLRERALEAVRTLGVGSGSVRSIAGTMAIHIELERRLAAFKKVEAVVVFQSGFAANAGTVAAIL